MKKLAIILLLSFSWPAYPACIYNFVQGYISVQTYNDHGKVFHSWKLDTDYRDVRTNNLMKYVHTTHFPGQSPSAIMEVAEGQLLYAPYTFDLTNIYKVTVFGPVVPAPGKPLIANTNNLGTGQYTFYAAVGQRNEVSGGSKRVEEYSFTINVYNDDQNLDRRALLGFLTQGGGPMLYVTYRLEPGEQRDIRPTLSEIRKATRTNYDLYVLMLTSTQ